MQEASNTIYNMECGAAHEIVTSLRPSETTFPCSSSRYRNVGAYNKLHNGPFLNRRAHNCVYARCAVNNSSSRRRRIDNSITFDQGTGYAYRYIPRVGSSVHRRNTIRSPCHVCVCHMKQKGATRVRVPSSTMTTVISAVLLLLWAIGFLY